MEGSEQRKSSPKRRCLGGISRGRPGPKNFSQPLGAQEKIRSQAPKNLLNNSRGLLGHYPVKQGFEANRNRRFTRAFGKIFVTQLLCDPFSVSQRLFFARRSLARRRGHPSPERVSETLYLLSAAEKRGLWEEVVQEPLRRALFCVFLCSEVISPANLTEISFRNCPSNAGIFWKTPSRKTPKRSC